MRMASVIAVAVLSAFIAGCLNTCPDPSLVPQLGYPGMSGDDKACAPKLSLTAEAMRSALTTTAPVTPTVAIPLPSPVFGTGEFPRLSIVAENVVSGYATVYVVEGDQAVPLDRFPTAETMGHRSRTSLSPSGDRVAVLTENVAGTTTLWLGPSSGTTGSLTAVDQGIYAQDRRITGFAWISDRSIVYSIANLLEGQDSGLLLQSDVGQEVRQIASGAFYRLVGLSADGQKAFVTRRRSYDAGWPDEVWAVLDLHTGSMSDYPLLSDDRTLGFSEFGVFWILGAHTRLLSVASDTMRGTSALSPETSVLVSNPDTQTTRTLQVSSEQPLLSVGAFVWHQDSDEEFAFVVNGSLYAANASRDVRVIAPLEGSEPIMWTAAGIVLWNPESLELRLISDSGVPQGKIRLE